MGGAKRSDFQLEFKFVNQNPSTSPRWSFAACQIKHPRFPHHITSAKAAWEIFEKLQSSLKSFPHLPFDHVMDPCLTPQTTTQILKVDGNKVFESFEPAFHSIGFAFFVFVSFETASHSFGFAFLSISNVLDTTHHLCDVFLQLFEFLRVRGTILVTCKARDNNHQKLACCQNEAKARSTQWLPQLRCLNWMASGQAKKLWKWNMGGGSRRCTLVPAMASVSPLFDKNVPHCEMGSCHHWSWLKSKNSLHWVQSLLLEQTGWAPKEPWDGRLVPNLFCAMPIECTWMTPRTPIHHALRWCFKRWSRRPKTIWRFAMVLVSVKSINSIACLKGTQVITRENLLDVCQKSGHLLSAFQGPSIPSKSQHVASARNPCPSNWSPRSQTLGFGRCWLQRCDKRTLHDAVELHVGGGRRFLVLFSSLSLSVPWWHAAGGHFDLAPTRAVLVVLKEKLSWNGFHCMTLRFQNQESCIHCPSWCNDTQPRPWNGAASFWTADSNCMFRKAVRRCEATKKSQKPDAGCRQKVQISRGHWIWICFSSVFQGL
jgi:hypothetical protein